MADTVSIGNTHIQKSTLYVVGGLGVVALGVGYYRSKQQATQNAAAAQTAGANTGIDPATGYPYGSQEDAAALSAQGSYVTPYSTSGIYGYGDPYYPYGYSGGTGSAGVGPGGFTTNAQWAQYVENYLVNTQGASAATVGNAIGKYLSSQALTPDMVSIVQQATAIGGNPPIPGPNGNPPGYITGSGTGPPPGTVKVPNCVGMRAGNAHNTLVSVGLTPIADPGQKPTQIVKSTSPKAGTSVPQGTRVLITT